MEIFCKILGRFNKFSEKFLIYLSETVESVTWKFAAEFRKFTAIPLKFIVNFWEILYRW